jgi:plastocyanin
VVSVRTTLRLLLPLVAAAVLAACSTGGGGDPADATPVKTRQVVVKDNRFQPVALEVPAGTEVTWSFQDGDTRHDVTGDDWKSGKAQSKGSYRHAFDRPGTFDYRCTLHSGMKGRVVVTGS